MGTGHMVEVNINTVVGSGSNASLAPQHPILYYVHKRPHCDDFLRRVSMTLERMWLLLTLIRYASGTIWSSSQPLFRSTQTQS